MSARLGRTRGFAPSKENAEALRRDPAIRPRSSVRADGSGASPRASASRHHSGKAGGSGPMPR